MTLPRDPNQEERIVQRRLEMKDLRDQHGPFDPEAGSSDKKAGVCSAFVRVSNTLMSVYNT